MDTTVSSAVLASRLKFGPPPTSYSASPVSLKGRKVSFKGMRIVEVSQNAKTGPISTTYMNQMTCPKSCPHLNKGCYAENGLVGMHTRRIEREAGEQIADMVAATRDAFRMEAAKDYPELIVQQEAKAIRDYLTGERKLRVHVVGDVVTPMNAVEIGTAMLHHTKKHGMGAWTYTHRWSEIPCSAWGGASVWASVETPAQIGQARIMGYPSAVTLPYDKHPTHSQYEWEGFKVIPCPAQRHPRTVTCSTCNLCAQSAKMFTSGKVLGFSKE